MPRKLYLVLLTVGGGILLIIAVLVFVFYRALQHVPELYREALLVEKKDSDEMVSRTTALISDVKKGGDWGAHFTAKQINSWLEFDLPKNHPQSLPGALEQPRVAIKPDRMLIFCRFKEGDFKSVVTLTVEPYLTEKPNVLALRICKARAGAVPWPLDQVLQGFREAAKQQGVHLQWQQAEGDPVALITIPPPGDESDQIIRIKTLMLEDGKIYLTGTTEQR